MTLPDIQQGDDHRGIVINQVGITDFIFEGCFLNNQQFFPVSMKADFTASLAAEKKGTHMSRFVELLTGQSNFSFQNFCEFLNISSKKLDGESVFLSLYFLLFLPKKENKNNYAKTNTQISWQGSLVDEKFSQQIEISFLGSNCCPCSKSISDFGAHNQKAKLTTKIDISNNENFDIVTLVQELESCFSSPVYPLLKRTDEKQITETQYKNPKFVEDIVRDGVQKIREIFGNSVAFSITTKAYESIHEHNAICRYASENFC